MIISVSRRTDIPAYFSEWFYNRLKEGFVYTANPFNPQMVHKVSLRYDDVTCFVFWTKNPKPLLKRIDELKDYKYYFQFTLTSYEKDIEQNLPTKNELVRTFIELSKRIGKDKVIWRYDPILINDKYTKEYHYKWFYELCKRLSDYTNKCIISFIDLYDKTKRNTRGYNIHELNDSEIEEISKRLSEIASKYNLPIETCSEKIDLSKYNINHGKCIEDRLIKKITKNDSLQIEKDKYQRIECGCVRSVDIGSYNTCLHNCIYCYANYNRSSILTNLKKHDDTSPLLIGEITKDMKIYEKK